MPTWALYVPVRSTTAKQALFIPWVAWTPNITPSLSTTQSPYKKNKAVDTLVNLPEEMMLFGGLRNSIKY